MNKYRMLHPTILEYIFFLSICREVSKIVYINYKDRKFQRIGMMLGIFFDYSVEICKKGRLSIYIWKLRNMLLKNMNPKRSHNGN